MEPIVQNDGAGIPRYLTFPSGAPDEALSKLPPQAHTNIFLERNAQLLALKPDTLRSLAQPLAALPEVELAGVRFEVEKRLMDSVIVGYVQTYFGLPVMDAGVSVSLRDTPRAIQSVTSTVYHNIQVDRPSEEAIKRAQVIPSRQSGVRPLSLLLRCSERLSV